VASDDPTTDRAPVNPAPTAADDVAMLARVAAELDAVEAALGRIDAGEYGHCAVCGTAIDGDDLRADPLVQACPAHRGGAS
jgi:RNA polymerase-binding transcription factor DksA